MSEFKQYNRKQKAELRPVTKEDIETFSRYDTIYLEIKGRVLGSISISDVDIENGSPKTGDMIARNPKNHNDQWLVAKQYFEDNFESC